MSIPGLIATLVILAVVLVIVLRPLLRRQVQVAESRFSSKQRERALAYYERVLTNVRDLDEDHATGKIDDADYAAERELWLSRGAALLKLLDELDENHNIVRDTHADDAEIDAAIEDAIQAARAERLQQMESAPNAS